MLGVGRHFDMDFGFLRASSADYIQPSVDSDRVVTSCDGYEGYLLIVDEHTRHVWVFLMRPKDPPVATAEAFLKRHSHVDGGMLRCDQGGDVA